MRLLTVKFDMGAQPSEIKLRTLKLFLFKGCSNACACLLYSKTRMLHMHCLVQVIRSLLQNEQIALDNYLQQIIPVLLTCIVAKQLGNVAEEDHWSVRDLAATAMSLLLEKFGEAYPELLSRVSSQLLRGLLDPTKPLTTHYGTAPSVSSGYWMRVCFLSTNQGRPLPSEPFTCVTKAGEAAAAARRF